MKLTNIQKLSLWAVAVWVAIILIIVLTTPSYREEGVYLLSGIVVGFALFMVGMEFLIGWLPKTAIYKVVDDAIDNAIDKFVELFVKYIVEPVSRFLKLLFILALVVAVISAVIYGIINYPLQIIAVVSIIILIVVLAKFG